jgi:hypothetical protein
VKHYGSIERLLEEHPYSLFPQIVTTERPDKLASDVMEGRIAILVHVFSEKSWPLNTLQFLLLSLLFEVSLADTPLAQLHSKPRNLQIFD